MLQNIKALRRACEELNITYKSLDVNGNFIVVPSSENVDLIFSNSSTPFNTEVAAKVCRDKHFSYLLLNEVIKMPKSFGFLSPDVEEQWQKYVTHTSYEEILGEVEPIDLSVLQDAVEARLDGVDPGDELGVVAQQLVAADGRSGHQHVKRHVFALYGQVRCGGRALYQYRSQRPDRLAATFQRMAKFGRFAADHRIKRDHIDHRQELLILRLPTLRILRAQYANPHFVSDNRGQGNYPRRNG